MALYLTANQCQVLIEHLNQIGAKKGSLIRVNILGALAFRPAFKTTGGFQLSLEDSTLVTKELLASGDGLIPRNLPVVVIGFKPPKGGGSFNLTNALINVRPDQIRLIVDQESQIQPLHQKLTLKC